MPFSSTVIMMGCSFAICLKSRMSKGLQNLHSGRQLYTCLWCSICSAQHTGSLCSIALPDLPGKLTKDFTKPYQIQHLAIVRTSYLRLLL